MVDQAYVLRELQPFQDRVKFKQASGKRNTLEKLVLLSFAIC